MQQFLISLICLLFLAHLITNRKIIIGGDVIMILVVAPLWKCLCV